VRAGKKEKKKDPGIGAPHEKKWEPLIRLTAKENRRGKSMELLSCRRVVGGSNKKKLVSGLQGQRIENLQGRSESASKRKKKKLQKEFKSSEKKR